MLKRFARWILRNEKDPLRDRAKNLIFAANPDEDEKFYEDIIVCSQNESLKKVVYQMMNDIMLVQRGVVGQEQAYRFFHIQGFAEACHTFLYLPETAREMINRSTETTTDEEENPNDIHEPIYPEEE